MELVFCKQVRNQKELLNEAVGNNDISLITEILSVEKTRHQQESVAVKENILNELLAAAIEMKRLRVVNLLLNNGANVKTIYQGKSHLSRAVLSGDADIIQSLLNSGGGDIAARDSSGKTLLHEAAAHSSGDIVRLLVHLGADVEAKDGLQGNTPMHAACTYCNKGAIRALLDQGAFANALNDHRDTPLVKVLGVVKRKMDFHDRSRIELGKELILFGFQIVPRNHVPNFSSRLKTCSYTLLTENSTDALQSTSSTKRGTPVDKPDKTYSLYKKLLQDLSKSLTLQGLCRLTIVTCISHSPLHASVGHLRLPVILQRYIVSGDKEN